MGGNLLTQREYEVFSLLVMNKSTKEIAHEFGISDKTVRNHISNVIQKLGVNDRTEAVLELLRLRVISLSE